MSMRLPALIVALAASACAHAQSYPTRPVKMVVGFPPGGGTDVVARIIAPGLGENLGQPVVIENRPGATGTVAAAMVARAPADGYTIMMGHVSVNAIAPSLFPNLQYDVIRDFAPVTLAASVPHFVVVHPSLPVSSIRELIAYARERPGKLSFPSAGNGSTPHLAGEIFKSMAGVDIVHVPYKGTGQSIADLLAGQHQVGFDTVPASAGYVRSGKMRLLGVSSAKRIPEHPDAPTVAESGVPGYEVITWYGVFAPGGTSAAIVNRLHDAIAKAMEAPNAHARLAEAGADGSVTRTPGEFAAIVRADTARYAKIIKEA